MTVRLLTGDCREVLRTLPDESVHCVTTSPPYWGLRNYQVSGQLGMERSLGEYIAVMVDVFREVRRVLRKDGTLWLNLGDCYASTPNGRPAADVVGDDRTFRDKPFSTAGPIYDPAGGGRGGGFRGINGNRTDDDALVPPGRVVAGGYLKPKDLCGIPWRVAFALQEDGWYLRQDLIWSKPNPMPESVRDRCTKAHEYLFLLSKSERYYFDQEAIAEPVSPNTHARISQDVANQIGTFRANGGAKTNGPLKAVVRGSTRKLAEAGSGIKNNDSFSDAVCLLTERRNKRSVWEVTTQPFSEAHFATFPPALIEPCIKAGSRPGDTILDPFGGAGTTGLVADRLQRDAILIELNPKYAEMARRRIFDDAPLFVQQAAE